MARETRNEMERIQKGLEEFLEREVPGYHDMKREERDEVKIDILGGKGGRKAQSVRGKGKAQKKKAKRKQKKKKSFFKRLLTVLVVLCLLAGCVWYYAVNHLYSRIQYEEIENVMIGDQKLKDIADIRKSHFYDYILVELLTESSLVD